MLGLWMSWASGAHVPDAGHSVRPDEDTQPQEAAQPGLRVASGVEFADEPLELPEIGLTMPVPAGSTAQSPPRGSPAAARIAPPGSAWTIDIQIAQSPSPGVATAAFTDSIVRQIQRSVGVVRTDPETDQERLVSTNAEVIERTPDLRVAGLEAERVVLRLPGRAQDHSITAFTVVRQTPRQFVIFQLNTQESIYDRTGLIYRTVVAAARFQDEQQREARRGAAVLRGRDLLTRLSTERFDALVDSFGERWERLSIPGDAGQVRELGYRRIRAWQGRRGEIQFGADPSAFDAVESESGYVLAIDARLLGDGGELTDIASRYFLSRDLDEEAWSVRMTVRRGERVMQTYSETGARVDEALKVAVDAPGEPPEVIRPLIRGLGYISQVRHFMLPEILVELGIPGTYGFYAYQSSKQTISLRTVELEQRGDDAGWAVVSFDESGTPTRTSRYTPDGRFVETEMPDGQTWSRTTLDTLLDRWRRAGLPVR